MLERLTGANIRRVMGSFLALGCLACNRYVTVEPVELARIAAPPAQYRETGTVRDFDGELVEIDGEFDAIVDTTRGQFAFKRPVVAWLAPGTLMISGANQPAVGIPLAEVRAVDLKQFSPGRTVAVVVPISVVALVGVIFFSGAGH